MDRIVQIEHYHIKIKIRCKKSFLLIKDGVVQIEYYHHKIKIREKKIFPIRSIGNLIVRVINWKFRGVG